MRFPLLGALLLALCPSCVLTMQEVGPPAVQRPTFSHSTGTTLASGLSLEMGGAVGQGGRRALPTTFRYGATQDSEITLGGDFFTRNTTGESGIGDLEVGFRQRLKAPKGDEAGWGVGWLTRLPTADADRGLGSGEVDARLSVARDRLRGVSTLTQYLELNLSGDASGSGTEPGLLAAYAYSRPVTGSVGILAELAGEWAPEADRTAGWLLMGSTLRLDKGSLIDVGVRLGIGDDAEDWAILAGFGRSLGRLTVP